MITISGHSDDVVSIDGENSDEVGAYAREVSILVGTPKAGLVVRFHYAPKRRPSDGIGDGGTWQARIDLIDEDIPIPWPVSIRAEGYTPHVVIDCPKGTRWRQIGAEE